MKLIFLGDIVGKCGLAAAASYLRENCRRADFTVVNGENIDARNGITQKQAEELHFAGADVITLGNHAFRQQKTYDFMDDCDWLIRPANYPSRAPGHGFCTVNTPIGKVLVISLAGQVDLEPTDNPFYKFDEILEKNTGADYIFVDFHAEATSEKRAFGYYADGRATGVFGTHTHIQTADEQFLPKGTAYITDAGMTGVFDSVLGAKKELAIGKFLTRTYIPLEQAEGKCRVNGVFLDTDKKTIERINVDI